MTHLYPRKVPSCRSSHWPGESDQNQLVRYFVHLYHSLGGLCQKTGPFQPHICSMGLEYLPTFTRFFSGFHAGKYSSPMDLRGLGLFQTLRTPSAEPRQESHQMARSHGPATLGEASGARVTGAPGALWEGVMGINHGPPKPTFLIIF